MIRTPGGRGRPLSLFRAGPGFCFFVKEDVFEDFAGPGFGSGEFAQEADGGDLNGGDFAPDGVAEAAPALRLRVFAGRDSSRAFLADEDAALDVGLFGSGSDLVDRERNAGCFAELALRAGASGEILAEH